MSSILFEPNQGQFMASARAFTVFLMGPEAVFLPKGATTNKDVMRLTFVNGNAHPVAEGQDIQAGRKSYFLGDDPSKWRTDIPLYGSVRVREIYRGIDVVFYGRDRQLEYDIVLQAGVDPKQVKLRIDGASAVRLNEAGDLVVTNRAGEMIQRRPHMYQIVDGVRTPVDGAFVLTHQNEVSFQVHDIRDDAALVIDPVVTYSSYLGGSNFDWAVKIRTDKTGAIYVMGTTASNDFPGPKRVFLDVPILPVAFISKFTPDGKSLIYTILYGARYGGPGTGITLGGFAVDSLGQTHLSGGVTGAVATTPYAFQPSHNPASTSAFVAKFHSTGSRLIYSTYLAGSSSDESTDLTIDASGNAYVVGGTASTDFPLKNPFQATTTGGSVRDRWDN